ncbi:MAG: adenosylmethionine--8-amino-7-oxononanoate transaminase [Planctomycetes bacterium]|nr:adenosylmethionine--8-amino-7-oxononanoate transaminase [Planctomycetota bacterium]
MNAEHPDRARLEALDDAHLWHPFTPMGVYRQEDPVLVVAAEGHELIDVQGRRLLDSVASLWCNAFGHRNPKIDAAIRAQLDRVAHSTLLGNANDRAIELAARLAELAPAGLSRVFFSDNGSTAVEVALKMAFQYHRQRPGGGPRDLFLAIDRAYHGDTIGSVAVGGIAEIHDRFAALRFPVRHGTAPHCLRCPLGLERATCAVDCLERSLAIIEAEGDRLAAIVVEPGFQGAAGILPWPEGFLGRLCAAARARGVLVIADEVASGLGRCGRLFASELEGIEADFLCLAKGLTGGYLPLAATITRDEIHAAFLGRPEEGRTFFHGHTFTGNQLGAAAALAALEILVDDGLIDELPAKVEHLAGLLATLGDHPLVGEVRQCGLAAGIEIVADRPSRRSFAPALRVGQRIAIAMRDEGVFARPLGDVLVLMPPLTITPAELDRIAAGYHRAIARVAAELPR